MMKKIGRIALALLLALSMSIALVQCAKDDNDPPEQPDNPDGPQEDVGGETEGDGTYSEVTVSLMSSAKVLDLGESLTVRVAVRADSQLVPNLEEAGLKLVWTSQTGEAEFSSDSTGLVETVTPGSGGICNILVEVQDTSGKVLASADVKVNVLEPEPPEDVPDPVNASIYVPFVTAKEDFIRGTDVSSLLAVLNSGARFKDWEGNSLGESVEENGRGFMKLLAQAGVNWIRLRVWNDPYDAEGRAYGGGNNDLETAITLGKWATDAGIRVLIDFHYSDFWADPNKQMVPKAWAGMDIDTKVKALADFTTDSLNKLLDAGVDVGMVQVGNETTTGVCGETNWGNMGKLFAAGCDAVHAVAADRGIDEILACIHFTNPERGNFDDLARNLETYGVNYDVFATSFYPEWHGSVENLQAQLKTVADNYGKLVMVAETSCAYTYEDGDGNGAVVEPNGFPVSVQGQASEVAAVANAVRSVGRNGLGFFYWENAWIPAVSISGLEGAELEAAKAENRRLWAEYGTGWASQWAGSYDPEDAGKYWGGPDKDNKAMFDFDGNPLESLNVFKYMTTGTTGYKNDIFIVPDLTVDAQYKTELVLPETAHVTFVDGTEGDLTVTWDADSVAKVDMSNLGGKYAVSGVVSNEEFSAKIFCAVSVVKDNLLQNPSFEGGNTGYDLSGWPGDGINNKNPGDTVTGTWNLHFWSSSAIQNAVASQTLTLQPGNYRFTISGQGGDQGENDLYTFEEMGGSRLTESFELTGYLDWKTPTIDFTVESECQVTLGVSVTAGAGAWGTFDDWTLYLVD